MNNIENWKKYIFSLPEQVFFEVMRNYLGDVKTPFNKHDLVDRLAAFLSRDETVEKILSLIDRSDAEIITAISLLDGPTVKELYRVFSNEKSYYDFYLNLLNLEERMLVFSEEIDGEGRISVSPVCIDTFKKHVIDPELIVRSHCSEEASSSSPEIIWLNDSVVFSAFSFFLRQGPILKIDGSFRKKVVEELKDMFPDKLVENTDEKLDLIQVIFKRLHLAVNHRDYFRPDIAKWMELGELTVRERNDLFLGAAVSDNYIIQGPLVRGIIETIQSWGMGFSPESIERIIEMICIKNNIECVDNSDNIINSLKVLGILKDKSGILYPENIKLYEAEAEEDVKFILQPNFDIIAGASISFKSGVFLSLVSDINRYADFISCCLTKESYVRALEAGFTGEQVSGFFEKYTGRGIPQNVMFSLQSWEKEFRSIGLFSGIVLTADEKKRKIIDNSGQFNENLVHKLGDGIYLVKSENLEKLKKALFLSGIEHIPSVEGAVSRASGKSSGPAENCYKKDVEKMIPCIPLKKYNFLKKDFLEIIDIETSEFDERIAQPGFTAEQKQLLKERIKRKIILFPGQITLGSAKYEKSEAKGLDYSGKIRLAEQAIDNKGYLLEILERKGDEAITSLIKPESLDKSGKNVILEGVALPDENRISILIGKASIVKKIKTSLFMK